MNTQHCSENVNVEDRSAEEAHASTHSKESKETETETETKLNNVNCVQFVSIEQFAFYRFFASVLFVCMDKSERARAAFLGPKICAL